MKGRIIVIEGNDCSGKETQTSLLVQRLKREGKKVELISFPEYDTPTGKIVGGPYLGRTNMGESFFKEGAINVDPKVASLYYAADRRYNLPYINELISQGYDVIIDRYVESNMAHQGCKIQDKDDRLKLYKWLETLEYNLLELPKPDLTILLHMPLKMVVELKKGRIISDSHEDSLNYLKNSEAAYLELAKLNNQKVIECVSKNKLRDILDIHEEIYQIVKTKE
jgi:dTMP kinase